MHFIADLFRAYQEWPRLFDPAFTPAQGWRSRPAVSRMDGGEGGGRDATVLASETGMVYDSPSIVITVKANFIFNDFAEGDRDGRRNRPV
jgi:hypothetical protein